jgi:hypothetical protein
MKRHLYLLIDSVDECPVTVRVVIESWLAFGQARSHEAIFEPSIAQDFGVESQAYAALSWLGAGDDPGTSCWMYANPVHFALQRDYFSLAYPAPLVLSEMESTALLADINRHFEQEGLQFCRSGSGNWFLRTAHAPEISTSLLREAAGHDVRLYQPQGPEAGYWKRLQNELQMLLHDHPVNQAREARGELAVNSLWVSGQGRLPKANGVQFYTDVYGSHTLALGLARLTGAQTHAIDALDTIDAAHGDRALVVMHSGEADFAKKVLATHEALRAGNLSRLRVTLVMRGKLVVAELGRLDLWKRWRRSKPLQSY